MRRTDYKPPIVYFGGKAPVADVQLNVLKAVLEAIGHVPIVSFDGKYTCFGCRVDDPGNTGGTAYGVPREPHKPECWALRLHDACDDLAMLVWDLERTEREKGGRP